MLTLEETGWRVCGNSLFYLCNFSLNQKLFQNKKLIKKKTAEQILIEETGHPNDGIFLAN